MVKVLNNGLMGQNILDYIKMGRNKVLVNLFGAMVRSMKENLIITIFLGMENTHGQMEENTEDNG